MYNKFSLLLLGALGLALPAQAQWQAVAAVPNVPLYDLFVQGDTICAASANRLYLSYDAGATWTPSAIVHTDDNEIIDVWMAGGVIYAATVINGVYLSLDGGQTWQLHNTGLAVNATSMFAQRGDSLYLATAGAGVYVKPTATASAAWQPYNAGMFWVNVSSIFNDQGQLWAGAGFNATLSRHAWNNTPWTEHPFTPFNGEINSMLAFTRLGNVLLLVANQGLYRSTDEGLTWTYNPVSTKLLTQARFTYWQGQLIVNLLQFNGSAVLASDDQGLNWHPLPYTLPAGGVEVDVAAVGDDLYLARQNGLWRLSAPASAVGDVPDPVTIDQNIPNPATGDETRIPITLSQPAALSIHCYDLQGKLLRQQSIDQLPAGRHVLTLDLQALPPGNYVYSVQANGQSAARIMQIRRAD